MRPLRPAARCLVPMLVAASLLACSADDEGPLEPVSLEGIGDLDDEAAPGADGGDDPAGDPDGDVGGDEGAEAADEAANGAFPGSIGLAGAGTARVEVVDGGLQLQAVEPAEGWSERSRQVEDDEIEVELVRDAGGTLELEVELDDGRVRVSWTLEAAPIEDGTIALGPPGELVVAIADEELDIEELRLAVGWEVAEEDRDDDEVELELVRGDAVLGVDLELDDGELELTLEFDSGEQAVTVG